MVQFIRPLSGPFTFLRKHKIFLSSHEKTTSQLRTASSICYNRTDQAIERERHHNPAVDDVIQSLKTARTFLKLDVNCGYHQLDLEASSQYITTFFYHVGLRRYTLEFPQLQRCSKVPFSKPWLASQEL